MDEKAMSELEFMLTISGFSVQNPGMTVPFTHVYLGDKYVTAVHVRDGALESYPPMGWNKFDSPFACWLFIVEYCHV